MKKILLFLLPTLLFSCIWLDGTTINGEYKELSGYSFAKRLQQNIKNNSPVTKLEEVIRKKASTTKLTDEQTEDDIDFISQKLKISAFREISMIFS